MSDFGLSKDDDEKIWMLAKDEGFVILTKDNDFDFLSAVYGCPPKVIKLACGNKPTKFIIELVMKHDELINKFANDNDLCLLELG